MAEVKAATEKKVDPWRVKIGDKIQLEDRQGSVVKYKTVKVTDVQKDSVVGAFPIPGTNPKRYCRTRYWIYTDAPSGWEWGSYRALSYFAYEKVEILVREESAE